MVKGPYVPDRGDIVHLNFTPQAGREQAGSRPALVLSPASYNRPTGLAVVCPVTTQVKGYPFEVLLPKGGKVKGAILVDHLKNLDWRMRGAKYWASADSQTLAEVTAKLQPLLGI